MVAVDGRRTVGTLRHIRLHTLGRSRTGHAVRCGVESDWGGRSFLSAAATGFDCGAGPGAGDAIQGTAAPVVIVASRDFRASALGENQRVFPYVRGDFQRRARREAVPRKGPRGNA